MTSQPQSITFSAPSGGYTLAQTLDPDHPTRAYWVSLAAAPYGATLVSAAFGAPAKATVTFDRFGSPSAGGTVVVRVGDVDQTVTLDAATGRATLP